ncbi:hypothetical protein B9Z55_006356 [Caenorhabditis nigoni]|uniref:NR LBD domain-containing protein n=1 Tax=Caenorhabditis nigoni TaxID=1611254 RepID=A0A2G5V557_9PELO|nr:hypothetical protein B9Z55_006356 [Caenorhabditis nigoni]
MNPLNQSHANSFNSALAQSYPNIFPNMATLDLQAMIAKMNAATSSNSEAQLHPRRKEVDLPGSSVPAVLAQVINCSSSPSSEIQQVPQMAPNPSFPPVICNICGAFCRRPHDPVFKTPILKEQQATENDLFMKKISIKSGSNPEIQVFLNIKQVTASFLKDVLRWPKSIEMFEVLEEDQKLELVHSQWIRILIITICENGAHLLDLREELSSIAHTFHQMFLNPQEIFWAKACLLFMMTTNEGEYAYPLDLNDALQNLHRETLAFDSSSVRFGVITMFLGSVAHLNMGAIQNMFESKVKKLLSLCL